MFEPRQVRSYLRCLPAIGLDPARVLEGANVSLDAIDQLQPLGEAEMGQLFSLISKRTPEDFSLLCGRMIPPTHLGVFGHALVNSRTLRELFETWERYSAVSSHPLVGRLHIKGNQWTWASTDRYRTPAAGARLFYESSIAGFSLMAEYLLHQPDLFETVSLPFARPSNRAFYDDFRLGDLRFDAPFLSISGDLGKLDSPLFDIDEEVREVCEARCALRLASMARTMPATERVRSVLRRSQRLPRLSEAAQSLSMSVRSLSRALAAEGATFGGLLAIERRDRAERLLRRADRSVKEVAWELGLSDSRQLRRMFRAERGMSISEWREGRRPS